MKKIFGTRVSGRRLDGYCTIRPITAFRLLKEKLEELELMRRFKDSREERTTKGKNGELQDKKRALMPIRPTYVNHHVEMQKEKEEKRILKRFTNLFKTHPAGRLAKYAVIGFVFGKLISSTFENFGLLGGITAAMALGAIPMLLSKIGAHAKNKKDKITDDMGRFIALDNVAGEFLSATVITLTSYLSSVVTGPISGVAVAAASSVAGYLVGISIFYVTWAFFKRKKYSITGFGTLEELKELPHHFREALCTLTKIWKKENHTAETKKVKARSFLAEFAEIHGKGLVFTIPYHCIRVVAGFVAGFTPETFLHVFIMITMTIAPYLGALYPIYYGIIAKRANSVVKDLG